MRSDDVSRIGQFSFAGTHTMLTFQRRFSHSPEAVWAAITDPKQLAAWYMQRVFIDGRLGGSIEFVSDRGKLHATGQILAWSHPDFWSTSGKSSLDAKCRLAKIRSYVGNYYGKDLKRF